MGVRKKYIKGRVERRLRRMNNISLLLILMLLVIVGYDSVVYKTPLYYLGFLIAGYFIGGIFRKTMAVHFDSETDSFTITTNLVYIVLSLLLITIRLAFGTQLMEAFDVVYASDALYLFFIGIYYSKWRMVLKKIDAVVYEYADRKKAGDDGNN